MISMACTGPLLQNQQMLHILQRQVAHRKQRCSKGYKPVVLSSYGGGGVTGRSGKQHSPRAVLLAVTPPGSAGGHGLALLVRRAWVANCSALGPAKP